MASVDPSWDVDMEQAAIAAADEVELSRMVGDYEPLAITLAGEGAVAEGWNIPEVSDELVESRLREYARYEREASDNFSRLRARRMAEANRRARQSVISTRRYPDWVDDTAYHFSGDRLYTPRYEMIEDAPAAPFPSVPEEVPAAPYPPDTSDYLPPVNANPDMERGKKSIRYGSQLIYYNTQAELNAAKAKIDRELVRRDLHGARFRMDEAGNRVYIRDELR